MNSMNVSRTGSHRRFNKCYRLSLEMARSVFSVTSVPGVPRQPSQQSFRLGTEGPGLKLISEQRPPCTLIALGARKIRKSCNVLQVPGKNRYLPRYFCRVMYSPLAQGSKSRNQSSSRRFPDRRQQPTTQFQSDDKIHSTNQPFTTCQ